MGFCTLFPLKTGSFSPLLSKWSFDDTCLNWAFDRDDVV
jgi:hypothetical protein